MIRVKEKGKKIGIKDQVLVYDEDHDYDSTDDDLDMPESSHGKGLKFKTFKEEDMAEHRFCVRHLYQNFQMHFKGENLKKQLWACAKGKISRSSFGHVQDPVL